MSGRTLSRSSADLDHTADIQIHGWAPRLETAMEQVAVGMFNYISELEPYSIDEAATQEIEVSGESRSLIRIPSPFTNGTHPGHDMESLLYEFLNEMLMLFCIDKLVCKEVKILEFDREAFRIKAQGKGERWSREKHRHGTEIKAITYSAMQMYEKDGRAEVFVIVVPRVLCVAAFAHARVQDI